MGVVAGGVAKCPSSETEMYGSNTLGIAQVSALGSLEASAPQRFKCISIMGDSNGGSTTVRSRGGVLSREGLFSEVPLYIPSGTNHQLYIYYEDTIVHNIINYSISLQDFLQWRLGILRLFCVYSRPVPLLCAVIGLCYGKCPRFVCYTLGKVGH